MDFAIFKQNYDMNYPTKTQYLKMEEIKLLATKEDFDNYLFIQEGGMYNMLDPKARALTNMSKEQWVDIIKNYSEYLKLYSNES